jgi:hypothetical protein
MIERYQHSGNTLRGLGRFYTYCRQQGLSESVAMKHQAPVRSEHAHSASKAGGHSFKKMKEFRS